MGWVSSFKFCTSSFLIVAVVCAGGFADAIGFTSYWIGSYGWNIIAKVIYTNSVGGWALVTMSTLMRKTVELDVKIGLIAMNFWLG